MKCCPYCKSAYGMIDQLTGPVCCSTCYAEGKHLAYSADNAQEVGASERSEGGQGANARLSMNKHEAAWLCLRVVGLGAGLYALTYLPVFFHAGWVVVNGLFGISRLIGFSSAATPSGLWTAALKGIFVVAVAAYLLFRGKALHRILMNEA